MHNFPIEHDASLSRADAYTGNDYSFNQKYWNMILSVYGSDQNTSLQKASKAKIGRVNDSAKNNPTFTYGPREFILSYGETSLYLQTMSDSVTSGVAPLKYVRSLFEQERLPFNMGWRPPTQQVTLETLGQMIFELYPLSGEALPEGLEVLTIGAVKDAFEGIDPVTHLLGNATKA